MQTIRPFLMFTGQANEAMAFYLSIFEGSEIRQVTRYGAGENGAEGTVMHATFVLAGQEIMCIDSPPVHDFTFTPSMSLYVTFTAESEIDRAFERLSEDGKVLMPLDAYPFSPRYGWLQDRFGVSWQLTLA